MLVYDITDQKTFTSLQHWKVRLRSVVVAAHSHSNQDDFLQNAAPKNSESFPFLIFGNKSDLASKRQVPEGAAASWAREQGLKPVTAFETRCVDVPALQIRGPYACAARKRQRMSSKDSWHWSRCVAAGDNSLIHSNCAHRLPWRTTRAKTPTSR